MYGLHFTLKSSMNRSHLALAGAVILVFALSACTSDGESLISLNS